MRDLKDCTSSDVARKTAPRSAAVTLSSGTRAHLTSKDEPRRIRHADAPATPTKFPKIQDEARHAVATR